MFIVLEGINGSGKSTTTRAISAELGCTVVKFPTEHTAPGLAIAAHRSGVVHLDQEHLNELFVQDRAGYSSALRSILRAGDVVCDRYTLSAAVYSGSIRDEPQAILPDLVAILDVPVEIALSRQANRAPDKLDNAASLKLETLREAYLKAAAERGYLVVDASQDIDEVVNDIMRAVKVAR